MIRNALRATVIEITADTIDTTDIVRMMECDCGALVTFAGVVRDRNEGRAVAGIEYQCYRGMASREGARIVQEISERFAVRAVRFVHRVGDLKVGETAMFVAVGAPHRGEAFAATAALVDLVKERLPIWKKERYVDETTQWL